MEWTDEKALNLIELYQNASVLWDPKDKNYYKNNLKVDAWENIGQAMGTSAEKCKNKMITLLSCFRREKMKIKKIRGTGKATSEIYNSKWFAFEAMSFLLNRDTHRKSRLNTESKTMESADNEVEAGAEEIPGSPNNSVQPEEIPGPPSKIAKRDPKLQMPKEAFGILKTASTKTNKQNNEIKSFLDFVGTKMMKYSEHTKNIVQQGICNLIFKADNHYFDDLFQSQYTNYNRTQTSQGYSSTVQPFPMQAYSEPANVGYYTGPSTSRNMEQVSQRYTSVGQPSPGQPSPGQLSSGQPSSGQPSTDEQYATSALSPHSEYSDVTDMSDYI